MAERDRYSPDFEPWGPGRTTTAPAQPSSNGSKAHDAQSSFVDEWNRRRYSAKPAFIPLLLGLVILAIFGAIAVTQRGPSPTNHSSRAAPVSFGGLRAVGAGADFHPSGGEPPADILTNTKVPAGSQASPLVDLSQKSGTYDSQVSYSVQASPAQVLTFYQDQLRANGWRVESTAPAPNEVNHEQILAQRPASDGNYWEIGVTVNTASSASSAGPDTTTFLLRLLVVGNEA